jgi:hypothetical protein
LIHRLRAGIGALATRVAGGRGRRPWWIARHIGASVRAGIALRRIEAEDLSAASKQGEDRAPRRNDRSEACDRCERVMMGVSRDSSRHVGSDCKLRTSRTLLG